MAKIVKNDHHLEKEYIEEKSQRPVCIAAFVAMAIVAALCGAGHMLTGSALAAFLAVAALVFCFVALAAGSLKSDDKAEILKSGIEGEMYTAHILAELPRGYTVVQDVHVTYDGRTSEIDNIVVGKTGVFVIETKNSKGTIIGDYDDKDWQQHKIGRGGTHYDKTLYNPVKQVNTHIFRLANYLRKNGVNTYVKGIVYFANPEATLHLSGETGDVPVFDYRHQNHMLDYIINNEQNLTDKQIKKTAALIRSSK